MENENGKDKASKDAEGKSIWTQKKGGKGKRGDKGNSDEVQDGNITKSSKKKGETKGGQLASGSECDCEESESPCNRHKSGREHGDREERESKNKRDMQSSQASGRELGCDHEERQQSRRRANTREEEASSRTL